jgi:hypothetical protein
MSLKDTARTVAVLATLHDAIGDQLKTAKKELETGLKDAKAETGTQKIAVSLDEGQDVGSVTLVQPKPAAAWVVSFGDRFRSEVERKFVTSVKPGFQKKLLAEITAAGVAEWADPETGVIHEVPGVTMQGRAAYTRLTVPDEGKAAIAEAWRAGTLPLPGVGGPAAIEPGGEDVEKLRAELAELRERDRWLSALEAAGVDNWQGIDYARELRGGGDDA